MVDPINPLEQTHVDCLDRVLASAPITADLLIKCAQCFEPNPALAQHVQELTEQNAAQLEIARRLRQTFAPSQPQY